MSPDLYREKLEEAVKFYDEELGLDYFQEFLDDGYVLGVYSPEHLRPDKHRGVEEVEPEEFLGGMTAGFQGYEEGRGLDHSFYQKIVNGGIELFMPPEKAFALEFDEPVDALETYRAMDTENVHPQLKYDDRFQLVFFAEDPGESLDRRTGTETGSGFPGVRAPFSVKGETLFDEVEHSKVSIPLRPNELEGFREVDAAIESVRAEMEDRKHLFSAEETDPVALKELLDQMRI